MGCPAASGEDALAGGSCHAPRWRRIFSTTRESSLAAMTGMEFWQTVQHSGSTCQTRGIKWRAAEWARGAGRFSTCGQSAPESGRSSRTRNHSAFRTRHSAFNRGRGRARWCGCIRPGKREGWRRISDTCWVPIPPSPGETHRRGQPLQSGARNAKNAPESAIGGVLPKRPAPTGSVLWLVPISSPSSEPRRAGRTNLTV
jgi:hypothetical protein